jgi:hypothetical protein
LDQNVDNVETWRVAFVGSHDRFETVVAWLEGAESTGLTHAELEARLQVESRELFRQLLQDHLDLRAQRERGLEEVVGADGLPRGSAEAGHQRGLATVFGEVQVRRIAYRSRGYGNLHPADGVLNLPAEKHSHGLRRLAAIESARGSFEQAVQAIQRITGQRLDKRQVQQLASRAAGDVDRFYARPRRPPGSAGDVLVLSCDGKGIVMRPEALRQATRKQADASATKLATRLSKGEKRHRKRMAEVGSVYHYAPASRTPGDILPATGDERRRARPGPTARSKWLVASVVADAAEVITQIFDEATRRDPDQRSCWVALVDGNNHQIERIQAQARQRKVPVAIVVDFVHVLEYLWKAAWCFFAEGDQAAEQWVHRHALAILAGRAGQVAAAIRRKATRARLDPTPARMLTPAPTT